MSFPSSPSNNQIAIVNNIRYVYSTAKGTWTKVISTSTSTDQYARDTANSASSNTIIIQGVNTSQNTRLDAINNYSFGAYAQANLAYAVASDALGVWSQTEPVASGAFNKANSANVLAQAAFNTANNASSNTVIIQGVNTWQNTRIIAVDAFAQASFNQANLALTTSVAVGDSVTVIQGVNVSQNTRMTLIEGVNTSQNTRITAVDSFAQAAFNQANTGGGGGGSTLDQYARDTANSASSNTIIIQGVDIWQNTRMSAIESYAQSAYSTANSGGGGGGGPGIDAYARAVNDTQNNRLTTVETVAQAAFNQANSFLDLFDTGTSGPISIIGFGQISVYGQANVIADQTADTLNFSAGQGISITTDTDTDTITITNTLDPNTRFELAGLNPNTVPTVNSQGYLANNTNLNFYSSNNTLVITGNVIGGGIRSTSSATAPNNPTIGDMWYKTTTDILYRYTSDGTNSYWIDISGSAVKTGSIITGAGVKVSDTFIANTNQVTFTTSQGYDPGALDVYLNGIKLINGTDYVATNGTTVTLTSPASLGTSVEIIAWAEPINILSPFLFLGIGS